MKKLSILLFLLAATAAQAAPGNFFTSGATPFVSVFPDGTVYGTNGQRISTAGTTTCGIQEALNACYYTNALGPISGSGRILFAPGLYEFSGQIVINNAYPLDMTWMGAGKIATVLKFNGTGNAIVDQGHANTPAPRLQFVCKGIGFAYVNDTDPSCLVRLVDVNECFFEDCMFTTWQSLANSPFATLNYINSVPVTSVMTIGAYIGQGADNQHRYKNCTFYGLAAGLWDNGDHIRVEDTMFANCGYTKNGTAAYTNLYTKYVGASVATNILSLGGAITTSVSAFNDSWIYRCHFHFCNAALVIYQGSGSILHDCIYEGMNYCTLTDADNYTVLVDDTTGNNLCPLGDHLYTPASGAVGAVSGIVTHWQRDVFSFGSLLKASVGSAVKFDLSAAGVLTANGSGITNNPVQSWSGNSGNTAVAAATTYFFAPNAQTATLPTTDASAGTRAVVTRTTNLRNLYVIQSAAPGAAKNYTYTVMTNGVASDIVATVNGASATSANDTTHIRAILAGTEIGIRLVTDSAAATAKVAWALEGN